MCLTDDVNNPFILTKTFCTTQLILNKHFLLLHIYSEFEYIKSLQQISIRVLQVKHFGKTTEIL